MILAGLILAHFTISAGDGTIGFRGFRFDRAKLITRSPDQDQLLPLLVGTGLGLRKQEGAQTSFLFGTAPDDGNLARLENQARGCIHSIEELAIARTANNMLATMGKYNEAQARKNEIRYDENELKIIADRANLGSPAGQTALVTLYAQLAMLGLQIDLDVPTTELLTSQPPLRGGDLPQHIEIIALFAVHL